MDPGLDWREPGFFLISPEGTVTSASTLVLPSREAGGIPPGLTLAGLLRLNADQDAQFRKWLQLVKKRHRDMRWEKLARLAPLQEIKSGAGEEAEHIRLAYRKVSDAEGGLAAIAVFAIDLAPSRILSRQLEEERLRHKLEIRDFLALAANPPEIIGAFLEDAGISLEAACKEWEALPASAPAHGNERMKALWGGQGGDTPGHRLLRELHTIKGNAGAFGFDGLAAGAQESEELLDALKRPSPGAERILGRLSLALGGLKVQLEEIRRALKLVSGEGQHAMVRILKWKLERLVKMAAGMDAKSLDPQARALMELSRSLPFLSPAYLARKYRNLVERVALRLGKEVRFRITSNTGDIHPESFSRIDEAMVHILRNMVDHGIEDKAQREAAGKGPAFIELEYEGGEQGITLHIKDDGRGMDPEALAGRASALGLIAEEEAAALGDEAKLGLVFREGFSTRDRADLISGRGLGLALAARCVTDQGGSISVSSLPGAGTVFTISLPPLD